MSDTGQPREEVIPILHVADALASAQWYASLGFTLEKVHRFAPHLPVFATVARGPVTLFLSEHTGDARPDTLVHLRVPDGNRLRIGTPSWW